MRAGRRLLVALGIALSAFGCLSPGARAAAPLADWTAVVMAGDDRSAHADTPTEAFENARRDVSAALVARGFSAANITQLSLHPARYPDDFAGRTSVDALWRALSAGAARTRGGCLVYITSHGSGDGVVVGKFLVPPAEIAGIVGAACGARPTAVIISACFSGIFIPALSRPNRFVLTAARSDRSSFGCGEKDRYPFFDGCVIQQAPASADFIDLADRVKACIVRREDTEGASPRSQPQVFVGDDFRAASPRFVPAP